MHMLNSTTLSTSHVTNYVQKEKTLWKREIDSHHSYFSYSLYNQRISTTDSNVIFVGVDKSLKTEINFSYYLKCPVQLDIIRTCYYWPF